MVIDAIDLNYQNLVLQVSSTALNIIRNTYSVLSHRVNIPYNPIVREEIRPKYQYTQCQYIHTLILLLKDRNLKRVVS